MITKLRNLTSKYAIPSTIIIAVVSYLIMISVGKIFALFPNSLVKSYTKEFINILIPIGIVILFGFATSFKSKKFFRGLLCGISLFVFQCLLFIFNVLIAVDESATWKPWYLIIFGVFSIICVAIREECIYRATVQNILAKKYLKSTKGIWITAIVSALIFGLIHAFNIFTGVKISAALIQAVTNVGIGLFFAALYLRCGNLWVLITVHTVTDLAGLFPSTFLNKTTTETLSAIHIQSLFAGVIFVLIAIFLLRPSKCKEILQRFGVAEPTIQIDEVASNDEVTSNDEVASNDENA